MNRRRRLSERRKNQGLSQERLAEIIGVETSTVARWERGETDPLPVYRPRLADALKTTVEEVAELLAEADEPTAAVQMQQLNIASIYERLEEPDTDYPDEEQDTNRRDALKLVALAAASQAGAALPLRDALPRPTGSPWAARVSEAVLDPVGTARRAARSIDPQLSETMQLDPADLRRLVDQATRASLGGDHVRLAEQLPGLIGRIELTSLHGIGGDGAATPALLSDIYALAGWTLIKGDNPAGACIAAHRAIGAAEEGGDALRVAAATRCLSEAYLRAGRLEDAAHTAFLAAAHVETAPVPWDHPTALCVRGAALLSASGAAARHGDRREATTALNAAAVLGSRISEDRSDLGTAFGPSNVGIHRVAISVELGNAKEALRQSASVDVTSMPAYWGERRARYLIDVARAFTQTGDDTAATDVLMDAERIAPDEVQTHRHTHALLQTLLLRERQSSGLRELAARCHVQR